MRQTVKRAKSLSATGTNPAGRARLKDVAATVGVHPSTVSRALNPRTVHLVKASVAEEIRHVAAAMGYTGDAVAAALRRRQSKTVGFVVRDLTNTMIPVMFRGVENRLRISGYMPLLGNTYTDPARKRDLVSALKDRRVDGFIFTFADVEDDVIAQLRADGTPFVMLNRTTNSADDIRVLPDVNSAMAQVISHLVEARHERIAHIAGPIDSAIADMKLAAFLHEGRRRGIEPGPIVRSREASEEGGRRALMQLLDMDSGTTAIVCANDMQALGCLTGLAEAGLTCPADISIVGFNDMPYINRIHPSLTTVRIPHYEMGYAAADCLVRRLEGDDNVPREICFPTELILRESTARL